MKDGESLGFLSGVTADTVWGVLLPTSALTCAANQVVVGAKQDSQTSGVGSTQPSSPTLVRQRLIVEPRISDPLPQQATSSIPMVATFHHPLMKMTTTPDHTCKITERIMRELAEDCYKCVRVAMDLSYLYSKGFKQWLKIATMMKVTSRVSPSIQKTVTSMVG